MSKSERRPKTEFLQIRVAPDDRVRIDRAAASEFLDTSTWARKVILEAVLRLEGDGKPRAKPAATGR